MVNTVFYVLWKDLLRRKNHYFATPAEVFLPIGIITLINLCIAFLDLKNNAVEIGNEPLEFEVFNNNQCVAYISDCIVYEPSTQFTKELMTKAACYAGYKKHNVMPGNLENNNTCYIGVRFENLSKNFTGVPSSLNYTLFRTRESTHLKTLWRDFGSDLSSGASSLERYDSYALNKIVGLQRAIDSSYLYLKNIYTKNIILENTDVIVKQTLIVEFLFLGLFLAFSIMTLPIMDRIAEEKLTGAKELMLMMGVTKWQFWVAKFMDAILFLLLTVTGIVLLLFIPLKENLNYFVISPLLFWSVIMYGLISVILFLFFCSFLFEKSTAAIFVTTMIWIFSTVLKGITSGLTELPLFVKYLFYLFPHLTLMEGVGILLKFNFYMKKVKLTEVISTKDDSLTLLSTLVMMTINILIYGVLTWYLEQIKPGKYGVPQPYNFCFKKCYWFPKKVQNSSINDSMNGSRNNFELVPPDLRVGVSIQNVSKVFKSPEKGTVTAVDGVSLNFYHSEISALLGHNGAGKTTVFSMITGLSYPTSGKIIINGYDLNLNIREARRSLGLCPQHDMLFDDLTAIQILKFYGVVKGLSLNEAKVEALDLIRKLKLTNVMHTQAAKLSGGQRRKVSLAIALIGGSEVLVLDEPTAGMDPEIRREIWELLLGFRGARTILLTTHFMEEADALCDRIAIMDHGKIKCYGSPMFLKSKFGKGYILKVVVQNLDTVKELSEYIKQFIPVAKFKSQNIRTLVFELPESEVSVFPALLSGLEEKQSKREITSYSISLCTLEDVFLRLRSAHEEKDDFDAVDSPPFSAINVTNDTKFERPKYLLYVSQLWALIIKKWIIFQRSYKLFLCFSLLPIFIILIMLYFGEEKAAFRSRDQGPLPYSIELSLRLYPSSLVLYSHLNDPHKKKLFSEMVRSFGSEVREVNDIKNATHEIFENDFYTYARKLVLGVDFSEEKLRIYHNADATYMIPISLNFINNFELRSSNQNESIATYLNTKYVKKPRELQLIHGIDTSIKFRKCSVEKIPDVAGMQAVFYVLAPIKEHFYGSKGLQLMITTASLYWFSYFVFDIITFILYMTVVFVEAVVSDLKDLEFLHENPAPCFVGFILWGAGLVLINYAISIFLKKTTAAITVSYIIYFVFSSFVYSGIKVQFLAKSFQYLHPSSILKLGFTDLCASEQTNFIWSLFLYNCCLFIFIVIMDSKILGRFIHYMLNRSLKVNYYLKEEKDKFVKEEEEKVEKLIKEEQPSGSALVVNELKRWYFKNFRPSPAIRGTSFAVNKGECFGLLGVNGAGKTSTFRILTGEIPASCGSIYACSEKLSLFNRQKFLFSFGYCPQFGGFIPSFKGRELLRFFARLRGIPKANVEEEVQKWLEKMNILEYADQNCGYYSGGNQRKLSTAIALIGDKPLIFLDEPTTGVDPLSRRSIWNVIEGIQKEGQSVILTSHSMDECEALCSRLAIMVNGRFRCIGEVTTLKDRFGQGYCVQLKLSNRSNEEVINSLKAAVTATFKPECELLDEHLTLLQYHVKNNSITWANLFTKLNELKEKFSILESYTANATTLEQIFIHFARKTGETV